jgi:hypothetical protein
VLKEKIKHLLTACRVFHVRVMLIPRGGEQIACVVLAQVGW